MDNDFIKGVEIFVRCKKYAEARLKFLYKHLGATKYPEFVRAEINKLEFVLGMSEEIV